MALILLLHDQHSSIGPSLFARKYNRTETISCLLLNTMHTMWGNMHIYFYPFFQQQCEVAYSIIKINTQTHQPITKQNPQQQGKNGSKHNFFKRPEIKMIEGVLKPD